MVDPWGLLGEPAFHDEDGYAWFWDNGWIPEWSLPTPEPPRPCINWILSEVYEWIGGMTDEEILFAIDTGFFEAMGVYIPSDWLQDFASGGHLDFNDIRQDLVGWIADTIIEDSSGQGIDLLNGWGYVPGNSWHRDASSSDRTVNIPEEVLQAANQGMQSFILYDPRTHAFSVNWHMNNIADALRDIYGGTVTRIPAQRWRAETLEVWWNSLSGEIGAIVFFGHSSYDRLQLYSRNDAFRREVHGVPERDFGITVYQMQNLVTLNPLELDMMVLMGCNSGQLRDGNNIAMEFSRHVDGVVFASDSLFYAWPRVSLGMGGVFLGDGSNYFIAHRNDGGTHIQRNYAVYASTPARPGDYIRAMHEWTRIQSMGGPLIDTLPEHLHINHII